MAGRGETAYPAPVDAGRFREDYLRRWIAEDESKTLEIRRDAAGALRVSVRSGRDGAWLKEDVLARWHDAEPGAEASTRGRSRLGCLCVELGAVNLGTTYDLMFAAERPFGEPGDLRWRAVRPEDPIEAVRIFPEGGASWWEALLGWWDELVEQMNESEQGWIEPLSTYRPDEPP